MVSQLCVFWRATTSKIVAVGFYKFFGAVGQLLCGLIYYFLLVANEKITRGALCWGRK